MSSVADDAILNIGNPKDSTKEPSKLSNEFSKVWDIKSTYTNKVAFLHKNAFYMHFTVKYKVKQIKLPHSQ